MRAQRPRVTAERPLSPQEFERMLQRAEKFQKLYQSRLLESAPSTRKKPASAA